jgi:hypothetical protein
MNPIGCAQPDKFFEMVGDATSSKMMHDDSRGTAPSLLER